MPHSARERLSPQGKSLFLEGYRMGRIIVPGQPQRYDDVAEVEATITRLELREMVREAIENNRLCVRTNRLQKELDAIIEHAFNDPVELELAALLMIVQAARCSNQVTPLLEVALGAMAMSQPAIRAGQACRVCGCTNERACPGGCSWIAIDLCSQCAGN
jgi:hypothetical protein